MELLVNLYYYSERRAPAFDRDEPIIEKVSRPSGGTGDPPVPTAYYLLQPSTPCQRFLIVNSEANLKFKHFPKNYKAYLA